MADTLTISPEYSHALATRCYVCDAHHISRAVVCAKCLQPCYLPANEAYRQRMIAEAQRFLRDMGWHRG